MTDPELTHSEDSSEAILTDEQLEQRISRMKPSHRAWFDHYITNPQRDASAAARHAGFGNTSSSHSTLGGRLRKKYSDVIAAYDVRLAAASIVSPREVQQRLATIARDEANTRVSDRLKALELIARIHGMLQDKLDVDIALPQLRRALGGLISVGAAQQGKLSSGPAQTRPLALPEPVQEAEVYTPGEQGKAKLEGS